MLHSVCIIMWLANLMGVVAAYGWPSCGRRLSMPLPLCMLPSYLPELSAIGR